MGKMNLYDELRKCEEEMGGPFFNKTQNTKLKQKKEKLLKQE